MPISFVRLLATPRLPTSASRGRWRSSCARWCRISPGTTMAVCRSARRTRMIPQLHARGESRQGAVPAQLRALSSSRSGRPLRDDRAGQHRARRGHDAHRRRRRRHHAQAAGFGRFKSPSLRNVEVTGPYMHDGRLATLEAVLEHYSNGGKTHPNKDVRVQPLRFTSSEQAALIAFLKTLTDRDVSLRSQVLGSVHSEGVHTCGATPGSGHASGIHGDRVGTDGGGTDDVQFVAAGRDLRTSRDHLGEPRHRRRAADDVRSRPRRTSGQERTARADAEPARG